MSFFEVDGTKHYPFGKGSGDRIVSDYGLSNLIRFPIVAELSAAGDGKANPPNVRTTDGRGCLSKALPG